MHIQLDHNKISKIIQEYRLKKDISQLEVARHLGYTSSQFVSNWERGLATPPLKTLAKLTELLDIPPSLFMDLINKEVERLLKATFHKTRQNRRAK